MTEQTIVSGRASAALRSVFAASQNPPHPHHGRKRAVFVFAGFLLLTGGTARAQGPVAADRAALVTLYNATAGANWTNNTNWLSNEALSEWHGVDTDATGRVTELHLSGNELSGAIPAVYLLCGQVAVSPCSCAVRAR